MCVCVCVCERASEEGGESAVSGEERVEALRGGECSKRLPTKLDAPQAPAPSVLELQRDVNEIGHAGRLAGRRSDAHNARAMLAHHLSAHQQALRRLCFAFDEGGGQRAAPRGGPHPVSLYDKCTGTWMSREAREVRRGEA